MAPASEMHHNNKNLNGSKFTLNSGPGETPGGVTRKRFPLCPMDTSGEESPERMEARLEYEESLFPDNYRMDWPEE